MNTHIVVSVDTRNVQNMLNGYVRDLPKTSELTSRKLAQMYALTYLEQMNKSNIKSFTGESFAVLREQVHNPIKSGNGEYVVVAPETLVMLDSMRTHYVSLKRGRRITAWARFHGLNGTKVLVHKHPWIRSANIAAGRRIRAIAENEVNKLTRR